MTAPTLDEGDRLALDLLLRGFMVSRMLRLVADLGLADRIAPDDRMDVRVLAAGCGVQAEPLARVLRALAAFGVFAIAPEGGVTHTARSLLLRRNTSGSLHHAARFWAEQGVWRAWRRWTSP
jgi:hypothetical protein